MGEKGAKLTTDAESAAGRLVAGLVELGDVSSRKMFGGLGVFGGETMFGIIDSSGRVFFRAGEGNQELFDEAGSSKHGKMPYYSVPDSVLDDPAALLSWGRAALDASQSAKKR